MSGDVVKVRGLRKTYGGTVAVDGLHLSVRRGEVFGIVGPNGAGKTTTLDCIAGMRCPDDGEISVLGLDPVRSSGELRRRIGLQQQESELPERLRVGEALELFSGLFGCAPPDPALLDRVGMSEKRESYYGALSGGQKRRLFVALALVNDPELVILDELTSGLDPLGRRALWTLVDTARDQGQTVLLSTHYMDEAERLCDRVAVIHRGRVVALDTPEELIREHCPGLRLRLGCGRGFDTSVAAGLPGVLSAEMRFDECVMDLEDAGCVVPVIQALDGLGVGMGDLHTEQPDLEDVFLRVTGESYDG